MANKPYMYAIKKDGLIYSMGHDRTYFSQNIQHLVLTEEQVLQLPADRLHEIFNRNSEIPVQPFASQDEAVEAVTRLLTNNFHFEEINMSKRNKSENGEQTTDESQNGAAAAGEQAATEKASRSRTPKTAVIRLKVEKNPKREGSSAHTRFGHYKDGMTVGDFLEAGGTMGDINFDQAKGHIVLEGVEEKAAA